MEKYPWLKGAIINEVGMINCRGDEDGPFCIPNSGKYPGINMPDHACPSTPTLPHGLASYMDALFDMVIAARTNDGRGVVKGFSWFNENMIGGTYNLRLFHEDGSLNSVGEAYIRGCSRWGAAQGRR